MYWISGGTHRSNVLLTRLKNLEPTSSVEHPFNHHHGRSEADRRGVQKGRFKGKYKTLVGGAPVTQRWADRIGADAYAQDASDGVRKVKELLG